MTCPFSEIKIQRQEAAVLSLIKGNNIYVRLLSRPKELFRLEPLFCRENLSLPTAFPMLYRTFLQKLAPFSLLKLLIDVDLSEGKTIFAQVFFCFGCRVNRSHPAGPVLERIDKTSRENYIEFGRLLFFAAIDELCSKERQQECRNLLLGRNASAILCSAYPFRQLAQKMYQLLGSQDIMEVKFYRKLCKVLPTANPALKLMNPSLALAKRHRTCKLAI